MGDYVKGDFDFLSRVIRENDIHTILEIGSFHGSSACFFAGQEGVDAIVCVDPFEVSIHDPWWIDLKYRGIANPYWDVFVANIKPFAHKIIPMRGYSYNMIDKVHENFPQGLDMVYIDGNHSYEGCKRDIELYRSVARKILIGDDYQLLPHSEWPEFPGVRKAVAELVPDCTITGRFWWRKM